MATQTNTTSNAQTEFKRRAAARKGLATRLRNAARQNGSFADLARARSRAEANRLLATSFEAGRALDVSIGAAITARETLADVVRPLGDPTGTVSRLHDDAARTLSRLERRGEKTRKRAQRDLERLGRRARREAESAVPG
jgi:hypothetical protein